MSDKKEKEVKKKDEDWMTKKWRPMMAIMYMICCLMDFAIFPIMFTIVQFWETQAANDAFRQWVPITLQGGGLFHVAMGAVLGVSAFGRTQEKIAGASNAPTGGVQYPVSNTPTPVLGANQPMQQSQLQYGMSGAGGGWGAGNTSGFGSGGGFNQQPQNQFGSQQFGGAPSFGGSQVAMNYQGKKMVPEPEYPLL